MVSPQLRARVAGLDYMALRKHSTIDTTSRNTSDSHTSLAKHRTIDTTNRYTIDRQLNTAPSTPPAGTTLTVTRQQLNTAPSTPPAGTPLTVVTRHLLNTAPLTVTRHLRNKNLRLHIDAAYQFRRLNQVSGQSICVVCLKK